MLCSKLAMSIIGTGDSLLHLNFINHMIFLSPDGAYEKYCFEKEKHQPVDVHYVAITISIQRNMMSQNYTTIWNQHLRYKKEKEDIKKQTIICPISF